MNEDGTENTKMVEMHCANCGFKMEFPMPEVENDATPRDWDVALCLNCAMPSVIVDDGNGNLSLRKMTTYDIDILKAQPNGIMKLIELAKYKFSIEQWRKTHEPTTSDMTYHDVRWGDEDGRGRY